jgi:hypothetical protein
VQATTPERWRECRHRDARDDAIFLVYVLVGGGFIRNLVMPAR